MRNSSETETIVALCTPPGRGAISVLRMSGASAHEIIRSVFQSRDKARDLRPRAASLGHVIGSGGRPIDEVVVTYYKAPRSYTGEDVVEVSCHGNPLVVRGVLEHLLCCGARLAEPGEFSLRAFVNGKLDLAQGEGLRDLIASQTRLQAEIAHRQLEGALSSRLAPIKSALIDILVQLEAVVEFVEDEVGSRDRVAVIRNVDGLSAELKLLSDSFTRGQLLREGWSVALAGRPNVGKSSIFNKLLDNERAIVTEIPGTTRDPLRETIDLQGVPVTLTDTAGLRRPRGIIEQEGVRRSRAALADAHMVLLVLDASCGWTSGDRRIFKQLEQRRLIVVWNKTDLLEGTARGGVARTPGLNAYPACSVSAMTGEGIDELRHMMTQLAVGEPLSDEDVLITSLRHKECLDRTRKHLAAAGKALNEGLSEEFAITDLRKALDVLGEITGETVVEDVLRSVFSQFCIGK